MGKKIMTQAEARQIIRNFTGDSVSDAYLYTETLRSIANALPDKQEAIDFMLYPINQEAIDFMLSTRITGKRTVRRYW